MNDTFMTTFIASNGMEDSNSPDILKNLNFHNCKNDDIEYFKQDIQKYKNVRNHFIYIMNIGCDEKRSKN